MRSCLILRAQNSIALSSAIESGPQALLLRLGPCVEDEERRYSRERARMIINELRDHPGAPRVFVQTAPARNPIVEADLDALAAALPDGVFLEACEGRFDLQQVSAKLAVREAMAGIPEGSVKIVALAAQTPAAIFALGGYAGASSRLAALAFDRAALTVAMGGLSGDGRTLLETARALLVFGAAAAGVPALDCGPPEDGVPIAAACAEARRAGFAGMLAQTPEQIAAIESAFRSAQ